MYALMASYHFYAIRIIFKTKRNEKILVLLILSSGITAKYRKEKIYETRFLGKYI